MCLTARDTQETVYRKTNISPMFFLRYLVSVRGATAYRLISPPREGAGGRANGEGVGMVP